MTTPEIKGARIQIENLTKEFGDTVAVKDLSLDIAAGEMLVLLGPSGCGKTTTMRCVVGLEQASAGTVRIGDQVVFDAGARINVPANKRNAGMVFQSYAIWPHMTVFENVAFPLKMQNRPKAEIRDRVAGTLELVGLGGLESRGASMLSGGQMQRVALARSVAMQPGVLLLDEPLSNLDAKLRDKLRFELKEIQQELKITAIYVTHDQSEALALADRVAVMRDGVIVQLDDPVSMYKRPNSTFVADFLGVSNLFPAKVVATSADGTRVRLASEDIELESADKASQGDTVTVCVRPEEVAITETPPPSNTNVMKGSVLVTNFLGAYVRYEAKLDTGLVVDVVNTGLERPLKVDTPVFLHVQPRHIQLLSK